MSKTKQWLGNIDVTSPQDSFTPPEEPSIQDWALNELQSALNALKDEYVVSYENLKTLRQAVKDIEIIVERGEKPF